MDTFEEVKWPFTKGRRSVAAPIRLFRAAVGPVLLLAATPASLVGCASSSVPELVVPSVLYVPHDPHGTADLRVQEKQAAGATVTFDAGDLAGTAIIRTALDRCPVRLPVFRCEGDVGGLSGGGSLQVFHLSPAKGAAAGDSAVLRYRVTSPGRPAVTGSTRIVIGRPVLTVEAHADRLDVDPGGRLAVSLTIRNTGDVPARGVALFVDTRDGIEPAERHGNCRYRGGTSTWCRLPAAEVVIPPGASYRLGAPEVLRAGRDATYPSVSFRADALGTDYVPPQPLASRYRRGDGAALRLVAADARGAGTAHGNSSELKVTVRNQSDLVAVAGTARGPVGSLATVRVGVRNDGPGALPAPARVEFTVPPGTTVVSSPYEFERDEELIDQQCRALAPDGTPLTTPSARQPRARRYVCTARAGAVGATTTFPFTLRIDKAAAGRGGRVSVSGGEAGRPGHDAVAANDTAEVDVSVWPGPAWATPGHYVAAVVVLAVLALATALGAWRRRRSHRAGHTG
ncbi:hypothetical protein [Streptomyces sp. NPDC048106]|uniref:hypothetical protein n=1 Tax=Streptomyces sp. NPDC048106 TaxID=3155750 RepID=UPI003457178F